MSFVTKKHFNDPLTDILSCRKTPANADFPVHEERDTCEEVGLKVPEHVRAPVLTGCAYSYQYILIMILRLRQVCW